MDKTFVSDLEFENQEWARLIRCNDAGANIIDIEIPDLPEGFSFFSAKDIVGKNSISFLKTEVPVFADEKIEYAGQAVGILTGPDKKKLLELSSLFQIKTQYLSRPKAQFTFEEEEKNYFDYPIVSRESLSSGNAEEVFEKSSQVVYSTFSFKQRYHYHAETACVKTNWVDDRLEIHLATQWPYQVLTSVCNVLDVPKEKINVVSHAEAESLDGRIWFPALLAAQVSVASFLTKKNIVIEFSRQEDFLYTIKTPIVMIQHKTSVSELGKITAMDVSIIVDAGSFNPFITQMLKQMVVTAAGIYHLPVYMISAVAIKTEKGLTGLFSGWGDSYVSSALEKHISEIVEQLDLCPIQFRLQNNLKVGQKTITGIKKEEDFVFENILKAVCNTSDFYRKFYAYRLMNKGRKNRYDGNWRGIGVSVGCQYNGLHILVKSGMNYSAEITLTKDDKVLVKAEPTSEGLKRILKKQIAKELEVEDNQIIFLGASTDEMIPTGAATASCGISILPDLIEKCCTGIKNQRFRKPLPITVSKTYKLPRSKDWDNETLTGNPFISETPGACVIELELDPSTYQIIVRGIWFACDPGKIYSKKMVHRNIHKTIANAVSNISVEDIRENNLLPSNYKIIATGAIPPIRDFVLDSELKTRGLGELAESLVPAAYISALNQIMINHKRIDFLPVFTEDIFNAVTKSEAVDED